MMAFLGRVLARPASYRFVRGIAIYQVGSVVSLLTGMVSSVLFARLLGLEEFGLYASISATAAVLGLVASYGQETATTTFFGEAVGRKNSVAMERSIRYYVQASIVTAAVTALLIAISPTLTAFSRHEHAVGQYVRLVLLNSVLESPNFLFFLILQVEHRIVELTVWENALNILQILLATTLLLLGWGVWGILVGTVVVTAASAPAFIILYERNARRNGFPMLGRVMSRLLRGDTGSYAKQGLWMAVDQTVGKNLNPNLFFVVLAASASLEAVGIFRLAFRLATLPLALILPPITRMTAIVIPRISGEGYRQLISALKKVLLGSTGLATVAALGMAVVAPLLVPLLYGEAYIKAIPFLLVLLPINIVSAAHVLTIPVLRVYRRVWAIVLLNVVGIVIAIGSYGILYSHLSPLPAISVAILLFHAVSLLLFPYMGFLFRHEAGVGLPPRFA